MPTSYCYDIDLCAWEAFSIIIFKFYGKIWG